MNAISQLYGNKLKTNSFVNDGRPGFLADPTRNFTRDEIENGVVPQAAVAIAHDYRMPYAVQASIGFQKQLGAVAGLDSDLMYLDERNVLQGRDINLFFDPDTGYSLDPNRFGRPDPDWGEVSWVEGSGRRERFIWSSALTRRFRDHFQAGVTYSLSFFNRDDGGDMAGRTFADNQFDVGGEWGHANHFQRHTLRANWIVALSRGFSLAGLYLYGSGEHFATTIAGRPYNKPGANRLNIGAPVAIPESLRHRFDGPAVIGTGEVAPRNALRGLPIHKVDLRLSKVFTLPGRLRVSAVAELFNVFNHENFGAYNGQINSPSFGQPVQSLATPTCRGPRSSACACGSEVSTHEELGGTPAHVARRREEGDSPLMGVAARRIETATRAEIEAHQFGRLQALLKHAFTRNAFYRDKYRAAGFTSLEEVLDAARAPDTFRHLPTATKQELLDVAHGRRVRL